MLKIVKVSLVKVYFMQNIKKLMLSMILAVLSAWSGRSAWREMEIRHFWVHLMMGIKKL